LQHDFRKQVTASSYLLPVFSTRL